MIKIKKNPAKTDWMQRSVAFLATMAMMIGIVLGQLPGKIFAQEEKIFSVVLPYYEDCIYNYEEIQSEKRETGEIELFAAAGTGITFYIDTDKELDTVELRDNGNNTWMICQEKKIVFQMPERNLRLFVKMKEVSETGSDARTKETEMEAENKELELIEKEEEIRETEQMEPETKKDEIRQTETEKAGDKTEQTESGMEGKENEQIEPETENKEAEQMESEMEGDEKGQTEPGKEGDETEQTEPGTEEDETGKVELKMEEDETRQIETQTEEVETGQIETQTEEDENGPMEAQTEEDENGPMETEAEGDETEQIETEKESEITSIEQETERIASYYTMLAEAETAVPDTFKLICSEYPDYPHAPDNMQKSSLKLAMTSRKKVIFYEEDGTTTTRMAYCLQPSVNSPGSGDTYDTNTAVEITDSNTKDRNLMKALYYLYGGPAWDKEITYADGSGTANLKTLLYNGGKDCTTADEYYCLTHYILSYLYLGENGKWNYMYTTMPEGPVLNSYGVNAVKKIADEISKLPVPSAELSTAYLTASYHSASSANVTPSATYHAITENVGKIILPTGVFLVNETKGTRESGTVSLNGGDSFHLEAVTTVTGKQRYTIQTTYATDFTAMKLLQEGNSQDVGFSYYSEEKLLNLEVDWPSQGTLKIRKVNAETGTSEIYNEHYSFEGAVYGVYLDAACTQEMMELVTDVNGCASVQVPFGKYYLKELQEPKGFLKNEEIYSAEVMTSSTVTEVVVRDVPIKKKIQIQKKDSETDQAKPSNTLASLAGAEYTIYRDEECNSVVECLVMDEKGTAVSQELIMSTYYIKETKASKGYLLDPNVHRVEMIQTDAMEIYPVISKEQIVRGSLSLMKYLDDNMEESILQDLYEAGTLEGIRFTLVHEDEEVKPVVITTDRYGYAATGKNALQYGTWYLSEDPETTPEGYGGIRKVKIEITEDGAEKMYVVTNKPYEAYLCIRKTDKFTGEAITVDTAEFQIWDVDGKSISMPTFDGYKDTFATNEKGEIHLTKPLKGGTYSLVEVKAPAGYEKAEPIFFKIEKNAVFQEPLVIECENMPRMGKVQITKIDRITGEHCGEGFVFQIKAAEDILDGSGKLRELVVNGKMQQLTAGTVVDTITTGENGIAVSKELYLGRYEIQEVAAGEYYACNSQIYQVNIAEDGDNGDESIVAELNIENEKTVLELEKQDSITGMFMKGVTFTFWEKGKEEATSCILETDENGHIRIEGLKQNASYCLQETKTLPGYVLDDQIYEIYVDEQGLIKGEECHRIKLTNVPNVVEISKQDITGTGELPGAVLVIEDSQGNVVEQWVSEEKPHRIYRLVAGNYTLIEITAPDGYEVAERIGFKLTDSLEVQQIVMYDRPSEPETKSSTEEETESETQVLPEPETESETQAVPETENETQKMTELETENETQKQDDIVIVNGGGSAKTGDMTPIAGMLFLAICSMIFCVAELLRRIKY